MPNPISIGVPLLPPNNSTYSQAMQMGDLVFVSGQLGVDHVTRNLVPGGIQAQTSQAIDNIAAILKAAGSGMELVAKVTIFITDFSLLGEMNKVYATRFPHRPAKTTVQIGRLDKDALIEIDVIAGKAPSTVC
jgi:2-iminobutanoate/2-iminopropanoate deaminase